MKSRNEKESKIYSVDDGAQWFSKRNQGIKGPLDRLLELEQEAVQIDIVDFIQHPRFLNYGSHIYPNLLFMADLFYNPQKYSDYLTNGIGVPPEMVPDLHFQELVFFAGYKSGKTVLIAIIELFELVKLLSLESPQLHYKQTPDQEIFITNCATSAKQAEETIWSHIIGLRKDSPWFNEYEDILSGMKNKNRDPLFWQTTTALQYRHKNVTVESLHSRSAGLVGRTTKCVGIDEIAKMDRGAGERSGQTIYTSLQSTTIPFGKHGIVACISNPSHVDDMICRLYGQCEIQIEGDTIAGLYTPTQQVADQEKFWNRIGFHYPTWEVNVSRPFESFADNFRSNPEGTWRDYGAIPSLAREAFFRNPDGLRMFFQNSKLTNPIDPLGRLQSEFWGKPGIEYFMHADPGLVGRKEGDKHIGSYFGIAVGHSISEVIEGITETVPVVDLIIRVAANPILKEIDYVSEIYPLLMDVVSRLPLCHFSCDRWNDVWIRQMLSRHVRTVEKMIVKADHYNELKTCIYSGLIQVPNVPDLVEELTHLERVSGDRIEPGEGYTKDISDCVAAICWRLRERGFRRRVPGRATQSQSASAPVNIPRIYIPERQTESGGGGGRSIPKIRR